MEDNNKPDERSRRWFLSLFTGRQQASKQEMVKMLTADGKLVEVSKTALEAASKKQRSSNKEIYDWMQNPSKENNS